MGLHKIWSLISSEKVPIPTKELKVNDVVKDYGFTQNLAFNIFWKSGYSHKGAYLQIKGYNDFSQLQGPKVSLLNIAEPTFVTNVFSQGGTNKIHPRCEDTKNRNPAILFWKS